MFKQINIMIIVLSILLGSSSLAFSEESITITTYYPSPYGSYNNLEVRNQLTVGDGTVQTDNTGQKIVFDNDYGTAGNVNKIQLYSGYGLGMSSLGLNIIYSGGSNLIFHNGGSEVMRITGAGNVGIGTAAPGSYKLYVAGNAYSTGTWGSSDLRWKANIETLPDPLDKLLKLRAVKYNWRIKEFPEKNFSAGRQIGMVAQELKKEFPELVSTDQDGYNAIAYDRFTAVLLEAIKAQQQEIQALKKEVDRLGKKLGR